MGLFSNYFTKLNPAQPNIADKEGDKDTTINSYTVITAYEKIEVVQRGTNLIVDSAAPVKFDMKNKLTQPVHNTNITKAKVNKLINNQPNMFQNIDTFKRNIYIDLILEGNAFIYFDGIDMYHLPASLVKIVPDKRKFIKEYQYEDTIKYSPDEIIHIKENSSRSIYRGDSRIKSALASVNSLAAMVEFQTNFFNNNAIPGLVLTTPNILSGKIKERLILSWMQKYNPKRGGKRPMILDGDFKIESLGHTDFRELDFVQSIVAQENKILKALGVPPILLDTGNNANVTPNLKLFYITTILPLTQKLCAALEFYFGYDLKPDFTDVLALRPELSDEASYITQLTNAGVMTRNEGRDKVRLPKSDDTTADELILPANVAGSNADPTVGGRPAGKKPEAKKPAANNSGK